MLNRKGLKVYSAHHMLVLAKNSAEAASTLSAEYGRKYKAKDFKRLRGPFQLCYQGEPPFEVSEAEFVRTVSISDNGIVYDDG